MNIKNMTNEKTAVLLLAFGGPTSLDEVEPFIKNVTDGKISEEKIKEVVERYKKIGGKSPLLDITNKQANALSQILGTEVFIGMRYWHPFIKNSLKSILSKGFKNIIILPLTPYYSSISIGAYQSIIEEELTGKGIKWTFIKNWHNHPLFIKSWSETISEEMKKGSDYEIIFSCHSVPQKLIDEGDPYLGQIKETIKNIVLKIDYNKCHLAFQSKGGGPIPWLGQDMTEIMKQIKDCGGKNILVAPIGFVSDNIETLYDIDIFYKNEAEKMGLNFRRTPCLNDNKTFIEALKGIIIQ